MTGGSTLGSTARDPRGTRVHLGRARLHGRVVAEHAQRPHEITAQLARSALPPGRGSSEGGEGRRSPIAHERLEPPRSPGSTSR